MTKLVHIAESYLHRHSMPEFYSLCHSCLLYTSVITHETAQEKIGFGCQLTFPTLSIVDPELLVSIPPHLTAYQGFDAFFHAAEGFIAVSYTHLYGNNTRHGSEDESPSLYAFHTTHA